MEVRKTVMESWTTTTEIIMPVVGHVTSGMDMESTPTQADANTQDYSPTADTKAKVFTHGPKATDTKENITKTCVMAMAQ